MIDFPYVFKWLYHRDKLSFQKLLSLFIDLITDTKVQIFSVIIVTFSKIKYKMRQPLQIHLFEDNI